MRLVLGDRVLDLEAQRIETPHGARELAEREVALLRRLSLGPASTELLAEVLDDEPGRVGFVVRRLQTKLEVDPSHPTRLVEDGDGFRLVAELPEVGHAPAEVQVDERRVELRTGVVDGGTEVLTERERQVLRALVCGGGEPVSREALLAGIWGRTESRSRRPDAVISKLRGRLEWLPDRPRALITERGEGWRWVAPTPPEVDLSGVTRPLTAWVALATALGVAPGRPAELEGAPRRLAAWLALRGPRTVTVHGVDLAAARALLEPVVGSVTELELVSGDVEAADDPPTPAERSRWVVARSRALLDTLGTPDEDELAARAVPILDDALACLPALVAERDPGAFDVLELLLRAPWMPLAPHGSLLDQLPPTVRGWQLQALALRREGRHVEAAAADELALRAGGEAAPAGRGPWVELAEARRAREAGDPRAASRLEAVIEAARRAPLTRLEREATALRADWALEDGDAVAASAAASRALGLARFRGEVEGEIRAAARVAEARLERGDPAGAAAPLDRAGRLAEVLLDRTLRWEVARCRAAVALHEGRFADARARCDEVPEELAETPEALALRLIAQVGRHRWRPIRDAARGEVADPASRVLLDAFGTLAAVRLGAGAGSGLGDEPGDLPRRWRDLAAVARQAAGEARAVEREDRLVTALRRALAR